MWEIFDPRNGHTIIKVRWQWLARFITHPVWRNGLDYDNGTVFL